MDQYEWDEAKNAANRLKHGVGFELVEQFDWASARFRVDDRFDYGEERILAYGRIDGKGYVVLFVERGARLRIIGMRRAHEQEMRRYER